MARNDKLYKVRAEEMGITQLTLSERTGITENKISRFETGRQKPKDHEVEAICKALGKKRKDLF